MDTELTPQDRETLKAIAKLGDGQKSVRPGDLATTLQVSPATITARLKRLHNLRLADHVPYAGVSLTETGHRAAVTIIRRHRILERFLSDMLGYSWDEADALARQFEHATPREVVLRLYTMLDRPTSCPHGFPIPPPESDELPRLRALIELDVDDSAVIAVPSETQPEVIAFLQEIGITPGVSVRLKEKHPFDGPLVIHVGDEDRTIGNRLARQLYVSTPDTGF